MVQEIYVNSSLLKNRPIEFFEESMFANQLLSAGSCNSHLTSKFGLNLKSVRSISRIQKICKVWQKKLVWKSLEKDFVAKAWYR